MSELAIYNTLTRRKERFEPLDPSNVRMYVCGPTVYDFAHIGNARPAIVFDVLFRLLRQIYGPDHVTYVRNITDVDDKINARALRDFPGLPLNEAIAKVTQKTEAQYHKDVKALRCLPPTHEPHATAHVPGMVAMIQKLIDKGNAYVATGGEGREVLFDVASMPQYGQLSKRRLEEQQAGARIAVEAHKKNPADFVLWKESAASEPGWPAHFHFQGGHYDIHGRPGWHIECSVMSEAHLGPVFDIHGGGLDLIFPHHENEIAQSRCAHGTDVMANYWMHNGFLQVEGKKMSKSEGNFVTIHELLETEKFGGRKWPGEVLRLAMLMTHYREPIDFSVRRLEEAAKLLLKWKEFASLRTTYPKKSKVELSIVSALCDDINFNEVRNIIDQIIESPRRKESDRYAISQALKLLGFTEPRNEFVRISEGLESAIRGLSGRSEVNIKNFVDSAVERPLLTSGNVKPHAKSLASIIALAEWAHRYVVVNLPSQGAFFEELQRLRRLLEPSSNEEEFQIQREVNNRLAHLAAKNFAEADRIRDELAAQGIQLMDDKDPDTGERKTRWEVKR